MNWLNRLGIILNFVAGFMLAPELIGLERIKKAEQFLESKSHAMKKSAQLSINNLDLKNIKQELIGSLVWSVLVIIGIAAQILLAVRLGIFESLRMLGFVLLIMTLYMGLMIFAVPHDKPIKVFEIILTLCAIPITPFIAAVSILLVSLQILVKSSLFLILKIGTLILDFFSKTLTGRDRLRAIIISVGILAFILGNLFQLISTF